MGFTSLILCNDDESETSIAVKFSNVLLSKALPKMASILHLSNVEVIPLADANEQSTRLEGQLTIEMLDSCKIQTTLFAYETETLLEMEIVMASVA